MTEVLELVKVEALNAVEVFRDPASLDAIIEGIEAEVRAATLDASTQAGREQIRSLAFRVTRSKTAIVKMGMDLTEGWREKTKLVNAERKRAEERLAALAEEARRPLTEFENREKFRIAAHEVALEAFRMNVSGYDIAQMEMALKLMQKHLEGRNWEEFAGRARQLRDDAFESINNRIESQKMADAQAAELAELRRKEAERQECERVRLVAEREAKLKAEAAENARIEAERKAKAEADREAQRVIAAAKLEADRVAREKAALEQEKRDAETRFELAEKKAAQAVLDAQLKADREREAAVQAERYRQAEERRILEKKQRDEAAANAKREADKKHRAKIEAEAALDLETTLTKYSIDAELCRLIIGQIAQGHIRNVKVVY